MSPTDCRRTLGKLSALIGNTPLLELCYTYNGASGRIFAKCEQMNLTGSIKDRMALSILDHAYREGLIQPEDTIVEVTSGNTGIAFAALGAALGHRVEIYMPDWMSRERVDIIRSYGATVIPVTREAGGFVGALRIVDELAATRDDLAVARRTILTQVAEQLGIRGQPATLTVIAGRLSPQLRPPILAARRDLLSSAKSVRALSAGAMSIIAQKRLILDGVLGDLLGAAPTEARYTADGQRQDLTGRSLVECRT